MGKQRRAFAITASMILGIGVLGGCGFLPRSTFSDDAVLTEDVTAVRLDVGNGRATLRGAATATDVSLERTLEYQGDRPEGRTYQVEEGVLVLRRCGRNCTVEYTVDLPAGLPVTGESSNGAIELSRVGEVDVRGSNGAITLDGADGPVSVRTNNGRIEITLATAQDVQAQTTNGAINLTVPEGSYQVSADTTNGSTDIGVANDPAGDHLLELSTTNGSITVQTG